MILISIGGPAISFVTTEIKNKIDQINNSGDDNWWSGSEIDTSVDENDPYEFVTRELSDSGEVYDTELGYGEYVVGTDIPEGTYEVTLQSGYGSFQTDDPDNSIYLYGYFSENASDEDEDITEMEDVRLYEGVHVMIGEDVVLAFHTENGQTGQMQSEDNPLSVTYTLQPEKKYTVGKEIPAGVYDALRIEIGEAKGKNWWCVLYPQMCYVDAAWGYSTEESHVRLQNTLTKEEFLVVSAMEQKKVTPKIKCRLVELWSER